MIPSRKIVLPLLAAGALTFIGCATPKKAAEVDANGKPIEYVYITPVGSNIPVKVRKDQAQSSAAQTEKDQEALRKMTNQSSRPNPDSGG